MGSNSCRKLTSLIHAVSMHFLLLFTFISTYVFRLQRYGGFLNKSDKEVTLLEAGSESEAEEDVAEFRDFNHDAEEEEKPVLLLKFKFPTFEEFSRIQAETGDLFYEIDGNEIGEFSEDEEVVDGRFLRVYEETGCFQAFDGEGNEKTESMELAESSEKKALSVQEQEQEQFLDESQFCCEKNSDGFLSVGDFNDIDCEDEKIVSSESELSGPGGNQDLSEYFADEEITDTMEEVKKLEEQNLQNPDGLDSDFLSENDFNETPGLANDAEFPQNRDIRMKSGNNSGKTKPNDTSTSDSGEANKLESLWEHQELIEQLKMELKDTSISDSGDANKLESLWEHQELIEQLKMELKKARATGLPTILEESESPHIMDGLKPWKIDENFQHEDCMDELHKFYKSYTEMMRKFDILNYQKMYAMGFLQLKDPFQSTLQQKPSAPTLRSLVSQNLWLFKHKSHGSDPVKKFINELEGDLEVVYVGQTCLSWELLRWQYEKALELWNSDPDGIHRYNEVAGEFQQFQVLVQRFIEDGPFQGPRVQSYVKSRCVLRNLLQVPLIREDNVKDKKKAWKQDGDEYIITSDMLVDIVEESIQTFWRFVRSDKDSTALAINVHKKNSQLHNPQDHKLLLEIRKVLQKKERKLKDVVRSESCILRKFQRSREDDWDQLLYFFAQVDVKLVCRVLNMSKITRDQLVWCSNKLSRISFVNRKIYVEPAFSLFPC
ncbi:UNVERIFIED_CONTAM: hypothetical protein Sradi_0797300 [Sesamum radiatum]|uniref:Ribosomal protein L34Ae n=1 Tax=Sesamum radiatum TaxID=300843 RepID=A0AAW2VQY7_SESRA